MREFRKNITGRGASSQTANRFEKFQYRIEPQEWDEYLEEERPSLKTEVFTDFSRSIIAENSSPDVGFRYSINAYRGCEHGCSYCYARPTHEYLGQSAGLDFESKIFVKFNAAELLEKKLMSKSWEPDTVTMSGVTDCYQPLERKFKLTRACLEVFARFRNPIAIITKNQLVTRDIDVLSELAKHNAALVLMSITTLDDDLAGALEPRTSRPKARLEAVRKLSAAGIPVGVNIAPVIPGLNDHEIPNILKAASEAGARTAGYGIVRLPLAVNPIFTEWLEVHRPERKAKVLAAIRSVRDGKLNESEFGSRMRGEGPIAEQIRQMFKIYRRKYGLDKKDFTLETRAFVRPGDQMTLEL